jgi:hypothetical protein
VCEVVLEWLDLAAIGSRVCTYGRGGDGTGGEDGVNCVEDELT